MTGASLTWLKPRLRHVPVPIVNTRLLPGVLGDTRDRTLLIPLGACNFFFFLDAVVQILNHTSPPLAVPQTRTGWESPPRMEAGDQLGS